MTITPSHFGSTAGGAAVELFTLRTGRGMEARIATFGGVITFLTAPDERAIMPTLCWATTR